MTSKNKETGCYMEGRLWGPTQETETTIQLSRAEIPDHTGPPRVPCSQEAGMRSDASVRLISTMGLFSPNRLSLALSSYALKTLPQGIDTES